jgi:hypothetical protein
LLKLRGLSHKPCADPTRRAPYGPRRVLPRLCRPRQPAPPIPIRVDRRRVCGIFESAYLTLVACRRVEASHAGPPEEPLSPRGACSAHGPMLVSAPRSVPTRASAMSSTHSTFLQDRRRVSGTIGASRVEQRPLHTCRWRISPGILQLLVNALWPASSAGPTPDFMPAIRWNRPRERIYQQYRVMRPSPQRAASAISRA